MAYYNVCPYCGTNLDPGEQCDCQAESELKLQRMRALRKRQAEVMQAAEREGSWEQMILMI